MAHQPGRDAAAVRTVPRLLPGDFESAAPLRAACAMAKSYAGPGADRRGFARRVPGHVAHEHGAVDACGTGGSAACDFRRPGCAGRRLRTVRDLSSAGPNL